MRTTSANVGKILDTDLLPTTIDIFIGVANRIVTEILGDDTSLSSDQKADVEMFLTAHLIACTREKQAISENIDEASIKYQGQTGMGLDSTFYGQQVRLIDTSGKMAMSVGRRAMKTYAVTSFDET